MLALVMFAVAAAAPSHANSFMTGNELYTRCQSTLRENIDICSAYIGGVVDGQNVITSTLSINGVFCEPEGVTVQQLMDVVARWLRQHPEKRHYTAASLTLEALDDAFPCRSEATQ